MPLNGSCAPQPRISCDLPLQEITPVKVANKAGGAIVPVMTDETLLKVMPQALC